MIYLNNIFSAPDNTAYTLQRNIILSEGWYGTGNDPRIDGGGPDYVTMVELKDDYYIAARISAQYRAFCDDWDKYLPPLDLYIDILYLLVCIISDLINTIS